MNRFFELQSAHTGRTWGAIKIEDGEREAAVSLTEATKDKITEQFAAMGLKDEVKVIEVLDNVSGDWGEVVSNFNQS